ncbi:hypothetical protein D3C73_1350690 [compost metagenome]
MAEFRNRWGEREIIHDCTTTQGKAHAVGQLHVAGVQRDQQTARQQPVDGPHIMAFVGDRSPALRLGYCAHGPAAELVQQGHRPVRCRGQDGAQVLRSGGPALQGQGRVHWSAGGVDTGTALMKLGHQLHYPLGKGRL